MTLPRVRWIGQEVPTELRREAGAIAFDRASWTAPLDPDADLIVLAPEKTEDLLLLPAEAVRAAGVPVLLYGASLAEDEVRLAVNRLGAFRVLGARDRQPGRELREAVETAAAEKKVRREREHVLADFSRRNRELEKLTEALEKAIVERTGVLEESARDEKEKLGKERQLIRFLSELSVQNSAEDILRVLRRDLRRFHRVQSLIAGVREAGRPTQFYCSRGDKVLRAEGGEEPASFENDEKRLRQTLANRFGRPFNKLLFMPLSLREPSQGFFGVEYSMLGENELAEITQILRERRRATGIALERLSLEDRQRRFAVRWEKTFDGFGDPIAVVDSTLQVLRGNRSFSTALQRKKCFETFAARTEPCEGCPVGKDPTSERDLEGTVRVGSRLYRLRSWPVREPGAPRISGRVTHYDDITESRELSLRMLQSEKMSAIGDLAGHIAHELNNPLTGIRSLAQVLKAEWTEKALNDDLSHIENAARRCQNIIRHLLEFTKEGDGQAVPVRLDEIVEITLPLLKTSLRRHRQEMLLSAGKARILADPHLLQQVVFNLVNNACQAMKDPGRIGIATKAIEEGGRRWVELRVIDDGPGIPREIRDRLFEPFVTTKKEGEGTGLGLSTSKAIVEKFGGQIRFQSEPGQGTEFILRFPRKEDE